MTIVDKAGQLVKNGDIIDLNQTVNGQRLFIVLDVETLDIRYNHNINRKYEYDTKELFRPCPFSGEVDFRIIGRI